MFHRERHCSANIKIYIDEITLEKENETKILFGLIAGIVQAENSYCFRFTWMGPSFNNESYANLNDSSSCEDTYPDACRDPMLITGMLNTSLY
jgi:hypothetical protein